jgi:hypothetical protein
MNTAIAIDTDSGIGRGQPDNGFDVHGFGVLRRVLPPDMAVGLRAYIEGRFSAGSERRPTDIVDHPGLGSIKMDVFNRFPEIHRTIFFNTPFVDRLKALLGDDLVLIPDTAIHRNSFGSWHKDARAQQNAGFTFHWEPDFRIATIGFYFQSNGPEYGGGLEIIRGSHTVKFPQYPADTRGELVQSDAGDAIVFSHNLDHKASWPSRPLTPDRTKYSVFLSASANNRHVRSYMDFLRSRPDYSWLLNYSYPDDLVRHATSMRYGLAG